MAKKAIKKTTKKPVKVVESPEVADRRKDHELTDSIKRRVADLGGTWNGKRLYLVAGEVTTVNPNPEE